MARLVFIFARFLFSVSAFFAAAQGVPKQETILLPASVLDRDGNTVQDLTKENFRAKVNGRPILVESADYSLAPRRIVVLMDMSGSMAGQDGTKWRVAREALEDLLTQSPSNVPIALLTFSDRVHDVFDFSHSRAPLTAWLAGTSNRKLDELTHGETVLYDAVVAGTKLLEPHRLGDALYVITDGGDNGSHVSSAAVENLLLASEIRLFVFLLDEPLIEREQVGKDSAVNLARVSGGAVFVVPSMGAPPANRRDYRYDYGERTRETIRRHTQTLSNRVNGFYVLRLEVGVEPKKTGNVSLEIVDPSGHNRKDVSTTYPRSLPSRTSKNHD